MSLLAHLASLAEDYRRLRATGADPFDVRFDAILSPTEGVLRGRRVVLLGTNNYLGLTFDPACVEAARDSLGAEGTGTTGSRIANGTYASHRGLEERLAAFFDRRHAMVFSTGYQANLGMLSALTGPDDTIVLDSDSHASIYDGVRLSRSTVTRFRHNDPEDLARRLSRLPKTGNTLIVAEGIYSMLGDTGRLREIVAVKRQYGAYLLVDEAHSMGVLGRRGRGLAEEAGVEADVDVIVGTFSKSLGAVGGFCVADLPDFDALRLACRPYMFTASLPPSVVASVSRALIRVEEEPGLRSRLMDNARQLHGALTTAGFRTGPEPTPIISIRLDGPEVAIAFWHRLIEAGVYMNLALPPATPGSLSLLRSSVSAAHTPEQLAEVAARITEVGTELGVLGQGETRRAANG